MPIDTLNFRTIVIRRRPPFPPPPLFIKKKEKKKKKEVCSCAENLTIPRAPRSGAAFKVNYALEANIPKNDEEIVVTHCG